VARRLRETEGEPSPSARTSSAWLLVPTREGIGARASLGSLPAGAGVTAGVPGAAGAVAPDPATVMRRTGPALQSAGLPTCQNHSPAARPAGAMNCTSEGSAGDGVPSKRPPSSAMAPHASTTAGERATRTTSAPCPRAVKERGVPACAVAPSAGATGVGTGACAAAGAASTAPAASTAAHRRRKGSTPAR
jgi:hypothetical protein